MRKYLLIAVLFLITDVIYPQLNLNVKASVNNIFRYGNGYEYFGGNKNSKEYFENLSDVKLTFNDVVVGIRYEISDPIEYGLDFKGIKKRYVEYKNKDVGLTVRGGDFFEIISRGLTLNTFENRAQGFDTGIDGLRVSYKYNFGEGKNQIKTKAEILGGDLTFSDFLNPKRIENYKVRDANFEISPLKFLTLGTNYVYTKGTIPNETNIITNITADLPEGYLTITSGTFELYASYAHKSLRADKNSLYPVGMSTRGDGFYSSLSYSTGGLGMTIDYKNYRFDLTAPNYRNTDRATKMLPFQNPPTAVKEHYFVLITRNPHIVNFNDEVGGQIDLFWVANDKLRFNLNSSVSSNHYEYTKTGPDVYQRVERNFSLIPSLDESFNPWWEVYLETEWNISEKFFTKIAVSRQNSVIYNIDIPSSTEKLIVTTVPVEFRYYISKEYTLKIDAEQQWQKNNIRPLDQQTFMNQLFSFNLTKSPHIGLTFNMEFTNDNEEPTGKKSWFSGEISYKLNPSNSVAVSYGSERGGLRCTNGVCRFVNPFEGLRLTVMTLF